MAYYCCVVHVGILFVAGSEHGGLLPDVSTRSRYW